MIETTTEMSTSINEITEALVKAQGQMASALKDQSGYGYNYSDLASVINSSRPALIANGLAVVQLVGSTTEDTVSVTTILAHKSGQFFKSIGSLPVIEMKGCNAAQSAGASLSYLKRYQYQSIIGQPSEDNDASSDGFKKTAPTPQVRTASPAKEKAAAKVEVTEEKATTPPPAKRGGFKQKVLGASNANSEL